ncbi:DNA polymerase delta, putative [Bodo saltans]|uniref:DNA polymerase n=1 Tax=Bodo saltans TaxID=75058 RepID=A0A0S4J863_BODSA|nr:DNA polymerase delta, putative [Bodo saltans]|eukprot:CUG86363.1 DNA polymerase delta, putative [Bodo saltans]
MRGRQASAPSGNDYGQKHHLNGPARVGIYGSKRHMRPHRNAHEGRPPPIVNLPPDLFNDCHIRRTPVREDIAAAKSDLVFQVLDCTQVKGTPHPYLSRVAHAEIPVVRLYGVTKEGNSVLVHCYNHEPYLWVEAPPQWLPAYEFMMRDELNRLLQPATARDDTCVRIETHMKQSLMHYTGGKATPHLKIVVQLPQNIPKLRSIFADGVRCSGCYEGYRSYSTFESNVIFPLRFLVDNGIGGCNWATIPAGAYAHIPQGNRTSLCQIEIACSGETIVNHEPVGEFMSIAPFRMLSIDIECQGRKGFFPEPEMDPVIQIACHCVAYGADTSSTGPLSKAIFTLNTCAPIAGAHVFSFATEEEMMIAWAEYLRLLDPDVITGYNISGFDFPYLLNRSATLNIGDRFQYWSRQVHDRTVPREKKFMSKQMGNREYTEVVVEGRVILDCMVVIQRDYKLRSYSLNSVAQHFLGEQKEDVHHSIISDLQEGNDETRRRLAVYCLKDAFLPVRLIEKLMVVVNNVEMARVTGVPIGWLLERGQQIKVFSQMLRKAKNKDLLFPTHEYQGGQAEIGYEGATVIPPKKGFYNRPIATLDFASLYPSIMMAHNLCYSTLVRRADIPKYDPAMLTRTPSGDTFVKKELFPGILPEILTELLQARKNAKNMMKDVPMGSLEYGVLNGRQLALKISANSVYGFTGATVGKLPCLEISSSVTSYGRQMIEQTKQLVEATYEGVHVIYGDTDSVMIQCVTDSSLPDKEQLATSMAFGKEAADFVSKTFQKPIKLEFEKVYFPFLLMNKKRYAGLLWTNTDRYDKLDAKGIETVRRDNCPLIANVISGVLNRILIQRSVESAVEFVKGTISDLLLNRLDISNLVITKAFAKAESEYKGVQAHIALVERMRKRDAASAPTMGDRVAFVFIKGAIGAKGHERSEDPIYVLENNIPIDTQYYLEHQLAGPLTRVFEAVLDDPSELLRGDHTRHIAVVQPSKNAGGMMKFVKVQLQCLSCRNVIQSGALCKDCDHLAPDVYGKVLAKRNHYESIYAKVWTQCQQCQGSLHQDVICTSKDCPVFYMRKKVQKDLREQQTQLDRFGVVDDW